MVDESRPAGPRSDPTWHDANQAVVIATLRVVRAHVERYYGGADHVAEATHRLEEVSKALEGPSTLSLLQSSFRLTDFERDILLLASCDQFDEQLPDGATFGVAMAALPDSHWSALAPLRPLRAAPLLLPLSGDIVRARLRLDERVLHFLAGISYLDERLRGLCHPVDDRWSAPSPTMSAFSERLGALWLSRTTPILLVGQDLAELRNAVASACSRAGLRAHRIDVRDIDVNVHARAEFVRLWNREVRLGTGALIIEVPDDANAERLHAAVDIAERIIGPVVLTAPSPLAGPDAQRLQRVDSPSTSLPERCDQLLGDLDETRRSDMVPIAMAALSHFRLTHDAVRRVGERTRAAVLADGDPAAVLWDECRAQARARLDGMARCIEPEASWEDLVLPPGPLELLHMLLSQVRQRDVVHREWRFRSAGGRGVGTAALFWGSSGTGKTLAAEVIARELRVDLLHVDLSAVVSKYIGETEKNLARVFDAAESGGAVLLFDEADALFGRRSEVRDSHDRYANVEVSYLLQRMESYRGLAILTTNIKDVMDSAFTRRLRVIVGFPFPGPDQREQIWRRLIPPGAPRGEIRFDRLASLSLSGGEIRNVVLTAAFAAAEQGVPLSMRHFAHAVKVELAKVDRPLRPSEIAGWY